MGLLLRVTSIEGKLTFKRSLERWQDCELEDGFRIIWLEKAPRTETASAAQASQTGSGDRW